MSDLLHLLAGRNDAYKKLLVVDPVFWARSGQGITGDPVTAWADHRNNGLEATLAKAIETDGSATAPPLGSDNMGRDCPEADTSNFNHLAVEFTEVAQPHLMFCVYKQTWPNANKVMLARRTAERYYVYRHSGGTYWVTFGANEVLTTEFDSDWNMAVIYADGANSVFRVNGIEIGANNWGTATCDGFSLFSLHNNSSTGNGPMAELGMIDMAGRTSELDTIVLNLESYLAARHNIPVTRLVAFGDSLSDDGNGPRTTGTPYPGITDFWTENMPVEKARLGGTYKVYNLSERGDDYKSHESPAAGGGDLAADWIADGALPGGLLQNVWVDAMGVNDIHGIALNDALGLDGGSRGAPYTQLEWGRLRWAAAKAAGYEVAVVAPLFFDNYYDDFTDPGTDIDTSTGRDRMADWHAITEGLRKEYEEGNIDYLIRLDLLCPRGEGTTRTNYCQSATDGHLNDAGMKLLSTEMARCIRAGAGNAVPINVDYHCSVYLNSDPGLSATGAYEAFGSTDWKVKQDYYNHLPRNDIRATNSGVVPVRREGVYNIAVNITLTDAVDSGNLTFALFVDGVQGEELLVMDAGETTGSGSVQVSLFQGQQIEVRSACTDAPTFDTGSSKTFWSMEVSSSPGGLRTLAIVGDSLIDLAGPPPYYHPNTPGGRMLMDLEDAISFVPVSRSGRYIHAYGGTDTYELVNGQSGSPSQYQRDEIVALATPPDAVVVLIGANDYKDPPGYTAAQSMTNLSTFVTTVLAAGVSKIIIFTLPAGYNHSERPDYETDVPAFNAALISTFAGVDGVEILDIRSMWEQSPGVAKPNYSPDGVHNSVNSAQLLGIELAAHLKSRMLRWDPYWCAAINADPLYETGTAQIASSPQGGLIEHLTPAKTARGQGRGNWANMHLTTTAPQMGSGANSSVVYTALTDAGAIVEHRASTALSVSVVGSTVTIGINAGVTTATEVANAVNADDDAKLLVSAAATGTGADPAEATVETELDFAELRAVPIPGAPETGWEDGDAIRGIVELAPLPGYESQFNFVSVRAYLWGIGGGNIAFVNSTDEMVSLPYVPVGDDGVVRLFTPWRVGDPASWYRMMFRLYLCAGNAYFRVGRAQIQRQPYLALPGSSGNYASIPNQEEFSPDYYQPSAYCSIDAVVRVKLDDWTDPIANNQTLMGNWETGVGGWFLYLATDGKLVLKWFDTVSRTYTSTAAVTATDGEWLWLRVLFNNVSGGQNIKFYQHADQEMEPAEDSDWTQIGATVVPAYFIVTEPSAGSRFEFGSRADGTADLLAGRMKRAIVRRTKSGAIEDTLIDVDFTRAQPGATSFKERKGAVVTVHQSGGTPAEIE